jgi:hypothetical protein
MARCSLEVAGMKLWGFWDWLGYAALAITTLFNVAVEGFKRMPTPPPFIAEAWVAWLPLVLLIIATVILVYRASVGTTPGKSSDFPTFPDPYTPPIVSEKRYMNEVVDLDGYSYVRCTFENCTYKFNGTTPVQINGCTFKGKIKLASNNPSVETAWALAVGIGLDAKSVEFINLHPTSQISPPVR